MIKDIRFCNIEEHFKETYEKLYNSVDDRSNMEMLKTEVHSLIDSSDSYDLSKVTPEIVREAATRLKSGKSDPSFSYSADCLKNGPNILFTHLSFILKCFLSHGHVTSFLLLATLVPIVKNRLGCITTSKNYRSIAISSLVLKLFDWVTLLLFGDKLDHDDLQFAYQEGASTTMCTWVVVETIGYFLRNDCEVFTCQTDMTKAFDLVKHSLLFKKTPPEWPLQTLH